MSALLTAPCSLMMALAASAWYGLGRPKSSGDASEASPLRAEVTELRKAQSDVSSDELSERR